MTQTRFVLALAIAASSAWAASAEAGILFWMQDDKEKPAAVEPAEESRSEASAQPRKNGKKGGSRELKPEDFVGQPTPIARREVNPDTALTSPAPAPTAAAATQPAPAKDFGGHGIAPTSGDPALRATLDKMPKPNIVAATGPATQPGSQSAGYVLDAMVGQVNGQPIYANRVFEPMHDELARLGQTLPRGEFRRRTETLVSTRLGEIVFNNLILGEAERDLNQQEQMGLQNKLREIREEILRVEGQSSEAVANQRLLERQGVTVDQKMTETREQLLVRRYMSMKLLPKINVTRRDIERYYQDNIREFNPPPGRTLRVIRAGSESDAKKIEEQLAQGKPFAEVASSKLNRHLTDKGGLMVDTSGNEQFFGLPELNEAANPLKPGEHRGPVKANGLDWWVYLESVTQTPGKPLREVQLQIEQTLKKQRYNAEIKRYRDRLFAEGTYNPIDKMGWSLVEIAMARYALPE